MTRKNPPKRAANQTMTAFTLDKDLFNAMERARGELHMDRSNFIRYCIAKELKRQGVKIDRDGHNGG